MRRQRWFLFLAEIDNLIDNLPNSGNIEAKHVKHNLKFDYSLEHRLKGSVSPNHALLLLDQKSGLKSNSHSTEDYAEPNLEFYFVTPPKLHEAQ